MFFFFNDTATTEIYTLSLHDALPILNSENFREVGYCERLSVNSCIQGSGGDIMLLVQPRVEANERLKELGYRMVIQVHDEIVGVCPKENKDEAMAIVKDIMEHPLKQRSEEHTSELQSRQY